MNLMNGMLAFDPTHRLSVAEIMAHNWWKGPVATVEEIQTDFKKKREIVEHSIAQAKIAKEQEK